MNIALLGYGKMGKAIEAIATERGHQIVLKADKGTEYMLDSQTMDVAIDFSIPAMAVSHITQCFEKNIPVLSGTTGWLDQYDDVVAQCEETDGTFLYASNFSLGVNILFEVNTVLAKLMASQSGYRTSIEEIHHTQKLDAPSGTAISLAQGIIEEGSYSQWILKEDEYISQEESIKEAILPIHSKREGAVPGTHHINYESAVDKIILSHEAHSRTGFALGAVIAAEWLIGKKGVFSMRDVLNIS